MSNLSSVLRFYYDPITEVERVMEEALTASAGISDRPSVIRPRMDMHENSDTNTVVMVFELPGLKPKDVVIDVQQNRLVVSGEFTRSASLDESGYVLRERRMGKFFRALQISAGVKVAISEFNDALMTGAFQPEEVTAHMEDGLLMVTYPKIPLEQHAHRITIT
ncbi:small heat shock protein [Pisolithus orientalis]|uniref:small heat shock protein n=1 Tax=Pisolithus orientalis TaxID=936130 RepID=UPI0022248179|nr:small heat shock protein [Pisolithus orientalis]KAI6010889.1 small heat shock protein [Pisolithus orientalis]